MTVQLRQARLDRLEAVDLNLDRESFVLKLLRDLSGTIERVVGEEDAGGYVATVGGMMGEWLNAAYHDGLGEQDFDIETVAQIFVDLKRRIDGGFYVVAIEPDRIVLRNTRCPFGDNVIGRPSLCMMTSNVFGRIAADNRGYARVQLLQSIARGDRECHVEVHLSPRNGLEADEREYYRLRPSAVPADR
ncbi:methanogen output domain 1-containing protein [Jiella mangrovi]|uniref:Transcriptional regulator n=1 Tax=Jiella mangrovi TaxID=2821407 RepID=A0ABS4BEW5_9HYPH|nr:methanogen output domain 1-containing protein [Jiella mangrovi]MBP0615300.1 transcriptional regulator [Jiella mangrovi]